MAIDATTIWEFRASTGAANNGGGYANLNPGTSVDYSNQAAAQLTINDGATSGIGVTTLTSVAGGFTAAMAGNVIYLQTGTNLTDGWYQITVYTNANTVTLDRAPDDGVGGVSGADGKVGGALDILTDTFLDDTDIIIAGQTIYIRNDGTMTLTGAIDVANDGTSALPINIEGYNTSRGDNPTGANRPLIAAAANTFIFDNYWHFRNLRNTTTDTWGIRGDVGFLCDNVDSNNSSGSGGRIAIANTGGPGHVLGCEAQSVNGNAVRTHSGTIVMGSYIHDSTEGIKADSNNNTIISCVIDTCTEGIDVSARNVMYVVSCTIYNCTTGIIGTTAISCTFINNIIDACTTGASWTSEIKSNWWDYNCWNNTTDTSNVTKGDNAVTADPGMANPAAADFSIDSTSPCANTALDSGDYTGATV